MVTWPTF